MPFTFQFQYIVSTLRAKQAGISSSTITHIPSHPPNSPRNAILGIIILGIPKPSYPNPLTATPTIPLPA